MEEAGMGHARLRNFVNGRYADPCEGGYSEVIDPSTGAGYAHAPVSTAADVDEALRSAATAFESWRDSTPAERSRAMLKFADAVERRADEFIAAETRNTGKPVALAVTDELPPSVDQLRFFAGAARILEGRSAGEYLRDHTSMIRREPIGVCAQVTPWNYPLMMGVWKIAPALAAGNTVVLKPSDTTPVSSLLLAEVAAEFFPAGVFNVICGDRGTGRALIAHDIPAMASITGSVRAGMEVARTDPVRATSSGSTSSSAARPRSSCSTTPTWRRRPRGSPRPASTTRARTAPPPPGCWPALASPPT
jgi:betaine-aldehyde dehydrogenase